MEYDNELNKSKRELREKFLKVRSELDVKSVEQFSENISNKIINSLFFQNADKIAIYIPSKNEVNIRKVIERAWSLGKTILVPKIEHNTNKMRFYKIASWEELRLGKFQILEPIVGEEKPFPIGDIEVMLIPGIVFDYNGNRIGYGKGYFDRYLYLSSPYIYKVGVCYNFQVVDELPILDHDYAMDKIITEKQSIFIK